MISQISKTVKSDPGLLRLLETAREYADIYLLARKTQKGCDGMGEMAMAKEEFGDSLNTLKNYCIRKKYLSGDVCYDLDSAADELREISMGESGLESEQKS